jgi:putative Holliday junction resolvase
MTDSFYYLGLDFGMRCIGVAVGQTASCHANPIAVLKADQGQPNWCELDALCKEWMVKGFVVGLAQGDGVPLHFQMATRAFAQMLSDRYQLPHYFVDEHYTTYQAKQSLQGKKYKDSRHDDMAAAIILQSFFDSGPIRKKVEDE